MSNRIQIRRGTTSEWTAANPVLAVGEPGLDTTIGDIKLGNGVTAWASLPFVTGATRYVTVPTAWVIPTYATGWAAYGAGYSVPGYRKIGDVVYLRGLIVASAGVGQPMFTLPVGFRPPSICLVDTHNSDYAVTRIDIGTDGVVSTPQPAVVSGKWVALDNLQFSVTA